MIVSLHELYALFGHVERSPDGRNSLIGGLARILAAVTLPDVLAHHYRLTMADSSHFGGIK